MPFPIDRNVEDQVRYAAAVLSNHVCFDEGEYVAVPHASPIAFTLPQA